MGDLDTAADMFKSAIQRMHDTKQQADLWRQVGKLYQAGNQSDAAIKALKNAAELDPTSARRWLVLGDLYRKLNRHGEAIDAYQTCLELSSQTSDLANELDDVRAYLGQDQGMHKT
jgi:tetratricopeptide (TPR) repeat protein